jgi:hypothetical protein
VVADWMAAFRARSWRARQAEVRPRGSGSSGASALERTPSEVLALLEQRCAHLLETLGADLKLLDHAALGAAEMREPIQLLSFTAGWMAGVGFDVSDALALVQGLRAALGEGRALSFFEGLELAACEAHQAAVAQDREASFRDAMSKAQVVCTLGPTLPCLFLVGTPDRQALDDAVGRLMTLAVMRGARRVLVDCATLADPARVMPDVVEILLGYLAEVTVEAVVSAVPEELDEPREMLRSAGVTLSPEIRLDDQQSPR